jgi:hypothetical protein
MSNYEFVVAFDNIIKIFRGAINAAVNAWTYLTWRCVLEEKASFSIY